jgi:hypothetical protein
VDLTTHRNAHAPTHRHRRNSHNFSRLDHAIVDRELARFVTGYSTYPLTKVPCTWSDHAPIKLELTFPPELVLRRPRQPRLLFNASVTPAFATSFMSKRLEAITTHLDGGDVDKAEAVLHSAIWASAQDCNLVHTQQRKPTFRVGNYKYNFKLTQAAKDARKDLHRLRAQRNPRASPADLHQARATFKVALKKSANMHQYNSSIRMLNVLRTRPKSFWQQRKQTSTQSLNLLKPAEKHQFYTDRFKASPLTVDDLISDVDFPCRLQPHPDDPLCSPITLQELLALKIRTDTATGTDGIPMACILRTVVTRGHQGDEASRSMQPALSYPVLEALLPIMNHCLRSGVVPTRWTSVKLSSIYKKGDPFVCKNYRPVSVPTAAYKLFCAVLNKRLICQLETDHVLHPALFGYRPGLSCIHPIAALHQWTTLFHEHGKPLYAAFVDLAQCFDSVSHALLFKALAAAGCSAGFCSLVQNMYSTAQAYCFDGILDPVPIPFARGIKQGCPLSPTLFNIFSSIIAHRLSCRTRAILHQRAGPNLKLDRESLFYADDITLIAQSAGSLQLLLTNLHTICTELGLSIAPEKSCVLIFHGNAHQRTMNFRINLNPIPVVQETIYLGCKLTDDFSLPTMQKHRLDKAQAQLNMALAFVRSAGLAHPQHIKALFTATVLQTAMYGVEIWGPSRVPSMSCKTNLFSNSLQGLLHRMLRQTLRLPAHTPNLILALEFGIDPMVTYACRRISRFLDRCASSPDPLFRAYQANTHITRAWTRFTTQCIHTHDPTSTFTSGVARSAQLLAALPSVYKRHMAQYMNDDTQLDHCAHRVLSTYCQHIWLGSFGRRHKVYNCMDAPLHQYRNWICLRTLNVPLAVYAWPRLRPPIQDRTACPSPVPTLTAPPLQSQPQPRIPLHLRACPLGCPNIADLSHFLLYCLPARNRVGPHLPSIVGPPSILTLQGFLNDKTTDSRALLASVSHFTRLARKHYKAPPAQLVLI